MKNKLVAIMLCVATLASSSEIPAMAATDMETPPLVYDWCKPDKKTLEHNQSTEASLINTIDNGMVLEYK